MPTKLPHIIVWGVRHDRSIGIDIPVYPSGLEESLYERGVALRGLGNNAINGGIDKRYKSSPFQGGVTGSNPVVATNWLYE